MSKYKNIQINIKNYLDIKNKFFIVFSIFFTVISDAAATFKSVPTIH